MSTRLDHGLRLSGRRDPLRARVVREPAAITVTRAENENGQVALLLDAQGISPVVANLVLPAVLLPSQPPYGGDIRIGSRSSRVCRKHPTSQSSNFKRRLDRRPGYLLRTPRAQPSRTRRRGSFSQVAAPAAASASPRLRRSSTDYGDGPIARALFTGWGAPLPAAPPRLATGEPKTSEENRDAYPGDAKRPGSWDRIRLRLMICTLNRIPTAKSVADRCR